MRLFTKHFILRLNGMDIFWHVLLLLALVCRPALIHYSRKAVPGAGSLFESEMTDGCTNLPVVFEERP